VLFNILSNAVKFTKAGGTITVTIDTVANAPANLAVAASSDSGTVGDRISNVGNPVISGTGESGASVTLFDSDGVTILGSATVSGASKWSLTSGALAQGTHMLTAKQTDVAGNTSNASSSLTYILDTIGQEQMDKVLAERPVPRFEPGDTLRVHVKVQEGNRERIQVYEGLCIGRKNAGVNSSFTVRKISFGEGVERVFPLYSPGIWEIEVVRKGVVRRAKLYYLRDLRGKASRIAEDVEAQRELIAEQAEEAAKRPRREKLKKEKPKDEKNVRAAKGGGKK